MAMMKDYFMDEVNKVMATINNGTDNEAKKYVINEVLEIKSDIDKALQRFAILKAVLDELEEERRIFWEDCCDADIDFEDCYFDIEKVEDCFD